MHVIFYGCIKIDVDTDDKTDFPAREEGGKMKKLIAVLVVLGLCGLYWYGCQKKEAPTTTEPEAAVTEPAPEAATTPPPPAEGQ